MSCRTRLSISAVVLSGLFFVAAGCGGSDNNDGGKGGQGQPCKDDGTCDSNLRCVSNICKNEVTIDEFASESAHSYCSWLFRCCTDQELTEVDQENDLEGALASIEACQTTLTWSVNVLFTVPAKASETANQGTYYPAKTVACLGEVDDLSCTGSSADLTQLFQACADAWDGLQEANEACTTNLDCVDNHMCVKSSNTCQALLAQGADCQDGGELLCQVDLYCDANNKCAQRKAVGADCEHGNECVTGLCSEDTSKCIAPPQVCTGRD